MQERKGSQVQRFKPHQQQQSMLHNHKVIMLRKLKQIEKQPWPIFWIEEKGSAIAADEEAFQF